MSGEPSVNKKRRRDEAGLNEKSQEKLDSSKITFDGKVRKTESLAER